MPKARHAVCACTWAGTLVPGWLNRDNEKGEKKVRPPGAVVGLAPVRVQVSCIEITTLRQCGTLAPYSPSMLGRPVACLARPGKAHVSQPRKGRKQKLCKSCSQSANGFSPTSRSFACPQPGGTFGC